VDSENYLLVLPVPFARLPGGRIATEGAFALHLRLLRRSLAPRIATLTIAAPEVGAAEYAKRGGWAELDPARDGIRFAPLHEAGLGRLAYLRRLPGVTLRLWREVGAAAFVHSGPSELYEPREILALVFAVLRRRQTIYTVDIDWHGTASMNLRTGAWSYGVYWRRRFIHDPWAFLQTWFAARTMSLLLLKGQRLVDRFGRGASHVHYLLNAAHGADMLIDEHRLEEKLAKARTASGTLRAVYFGRLTAYKGVDRMIRAVAAARARGAEISLAVYGDGEQQEDLRRIVEESGLREVVRFHGARPYGPEFLAEISSYDVLLAAPLAQDTPRSAVDAQACGVPVVAYDTYYYAELRDLGAGVACVPWEDVDALAGALVELSHDRDRLGQLIERGFAFARANTQEIWLDRRAAWTLGRTEEEAAEPR